MKQGQVMIVEFVCASVVRFADGTAEAMLLHRGGQEACQQIAKMLPAIAYSGPKECVGAETIVMNAEQWDRMESR